MKRTVLKENSSVFFIGKWTIIIAILITSSLSFILGYFVGKSIQPPVSGQTSLVATQENAEKKFTEPEKKETVTIQPEQTQETQHTIRAQQTQETRQTPETKDSKQTKETRQNKETIETKETVTPGQTKETRKTGETKKTPQTRRYSVQAGAFKEVFDADALKSKLDKKGYKSYVVLSETKKHKKLYKVMVGEFAARKEAEVLAIKMKRSEGCTFVVFKTGQEEVR